MKRKVWDITVKDNPNRVVMGENDEFYTTDTEAYLVFNLEDKNFNPATAVLTLENRNDGSLKNETVDVVDGLIEWEMPQRYIEHFGNWQGQLVYEDTKDGQPELYTSAPFSFVVNAHIGDKKKPSLVEIENWEKFIREGTELIETWEDLEALREENERQRQANYQELLDSGVLQTNINQKLAEAEQEYAPRLTELEQNDANLTAQLAQTQSQKVDKNGSGQITWANMAQDARENISGDKTAVVGIDSVLTENIADNSVTSPKRSTLGEVGILIIPETRTKPDYNTSSKTLTIYQGAYIVHRDNRYSISQDTSIPLGTGDLGAVLIFDTKLGTFTLGSTNALKENMNEYSILLMSIVFKQHHLNIDKVWSTFEFTVNGGPLGVRLDSVLTENIADNSVTSPKRSTLGEIGILVIPATRTTPDLNLNSGTFTIYEGSYIIHRDNRYNISQDTSIPIESGDRAVVLSFDTKTGTFRLNSTNALKVFMNEDSILLMTIALDIFRTNIDSAWAPFDFTLNGKPLEAELGGLGLLDSGMDFGKNKVFGTLQNIIVNINHHVVEADNIRYSHIAKIEPGKQYTIKKFEGGHRFRIALLSEYPTTNNIPLVPNYSFEGEESSDAQEHTFMNEISNYAVVFTTLSNNEEALAKVQVEEGDKSTAYSDTGFSLFGNTISQSGTSNEGDRFYIYDDVVGVYDSPDLPSVAVGEDFVLDTSNHEDIYELYDGMVSESPSYITRELLGTDTIDNPIYCYNFTPQTVVSEIPIERPKLILLSGLHGNEKMSVWGLAQFLKDMHDNWENDPILEFIRGNFELLVVPMCNPSGYDLNQRKNYNDVDLNRNFPLSNWREMDDPENINYGGPSPASEIETQIIVDFLDNNTDADYLVDFHNFYQHDGYVMWMPVANLQHKKIGVNVMNTLSRKWKKQYSHFPQDDTVLGWTNNTYIPTLKLYGDSVGIPSTTHESVHQVTYGVGTKMYDKVTTNCAVDWIGNYLAGIAKTLR